MRCIWCNDRRQRAGSASGRGPRLAGRWARTASGPERPAASTGDASRPRAMVQARVARIGRPRGHRSFVPGAKVLARAGPRRSFHQAGAPTRHGKHGHSGKAGRKERGRRGHERSLCRSWQQAAAGRRRLRARLPPRARAAAPAPCCRASRAIPRPRGSAMHLSSTGQQRVQRYISRPRQRYSSPVPVRSRSAAQLSGPARPYDSPAPLGAARRPRSVRLSGPARLYDSAAFAVRALPL